MATFKRLLPTILMLLFELATGILLLINGEKFTKIIFIIFGVFLLVSGLITLIRSLLEGRHGGSIPLLQLLLAVFLICLGAFFTAASGSVLSVVSTVTLVFGIILAFSGVLKLAEYLSIRKVGAVSWLPIIAAVVTIVLGVVIAFNPFGATEVIWMILGIAIIVSAVFDIFSLILFGIALKNMPPSVINVDVKDVSEDQ